MLFSNKREELISQVSKLEGTNSALVMQLASLQKDKDVLQTQVVELQKALVAKTSPEYYRDTRASTLLADPVWAKEAEKYKDTNQVLSEYSRMIESDSLITSKEDLEMIFLRGIGNVDPPPSLTPENSES